MQLPVQREKVRFASGGTECAAWHYPGTSGACVIMAGGGAVVVVGTRSQRLAAVREAAARAASDSIKLQSFLFRASAGVSHEPPAHSTFGRSRYDFTDSCVMPPVGQKRASGNGPPSAFSSGIPPAAPAGKNLK